MGMLYAYFFNIVSAHPSTTMSCVADKMFRNNTIKPNSFKAGSPVSGNQTSMFLAKHSKIDPTGVHIVIFENVLLIENYSYWSNGRPFILGRSVPQTRRSFQNSEE